MPKRGRIKAYGWAAQALEVATAVKEVEEVGEVEVVVSLVLEGLPRNQTELVRVRCQLSPGVWDWLGLSHCTCEPCLYWTQDVWEY